MNTAAAATSKYYLLFRNAFNMSNGLRNRQVALVS